MVFEANTFQGRIEGDFVWRVWRGSGHLHHGPSTEAEMRRVSVRIDSISPHDDKTAEPRFKGRQDYKEQSKGGLLI